jgi:glycosyltransferase involved in cell wall biosynthesis
MGRPLVSVVTPCLNSGSHIEDLILAVKAQTDARVEHVVVDGGSTDATLSILRKHRRDGLTWISEPDDGPNEAVNKGIRLAKGDIVGVLAADDLYLPWTMSSVTAAFEKNPDAHFVYGDMLLAPMGGAYGTIAFAPPEDRLGTHLSHGPINLQSVFWRRKAIDELGGFNQDLRIAADYDFCIRAARKFKFSKVEEVLAWFRYRKGSLSVAEKSSLASDRRWISASYFGGKKVINPATVLYEASWALFCTSRLLSLLGGTNDSTRWSRLRMSGAVSNGRLAEEVFAAPLPHYRVLRTETPSRLRRSA